MLAGCCLDCRLFVHHTEATSQARENNWVTGARYYIITTSIGTTIVLGTVPVQRHDWILGQQGGPMTTDHYVEYLFLIEF